MKFLSFLDSRANFFNRNWALPSILLTLSVLCFFSIFFVVKSQNQENLLKLSLARKESLIASISARAKSILIENQTLKNDSSRAELTTIHNTIEKYETLKAKTADYKTKGANVASVESSLPIAVDLILSQKYSEADSLLTTLDGNLETALKDKQAADAAAAKPKTTTSTTTCSSVPSSGYCRLTVSTGGSSFTVDVIAGSVSSVRTDTANSDNCANNCPTKALASYISSNGGYAGMNGTYFCPADYAACSGKIASYDFPVYNSNLGKWLNDDKLSWSNRAMLTFNSSGAHFYSDASSYTNVGGLTAGIVNFPGLVNNGSNIVGNYSLTSAQNTKGNRGGIGIKGSSVYLIIAKSASVNDLANIMVSMGMTYGLNLDGGGSSALYINGSYKVGPGRSLPNAVILK